mmetsp:Transcript_61127/g.74955  ORF Transcript_61127/g.74955 Transcript_61127/m.74955 type:complete len:139 (+) Transcript_61127:32-448(+)
MSLETESKDDELELTTNDVDGDPKLLGGTFENSIMSIANKEQHRYCEKCLRGYSLMCLGCCGCDWPLAYGVIAWYTLSVCFDIYTFIVTEYSIFLGIIYLWNLLFCILPVIYFTCKKHPKKVIVSIYCQYYCHYCIMV